MAAPAKFLFDMDFSAPDKTRERPATSAEVAQKMATAEARGYRDGFDAGQREAKAESDRRAALALEEIGIGIEAIARRFAGIETRMETEAVDVAVAVARKLCSELISAEPLGAITGLTSSRRRIWWCGSTTLCTRPRANRSSGWRSEAASRAVW
jgi:flagellar assembly protein FliH